MGDKGEVNDKLNSLLNASYKLFLLNGVNNTTVDDIVSEANVAKGTFYVYFHDKYDLQKQLVIRKSYELFRQAMQELSGLYITDFGDQIIFVINYVIDRLVDNPDLGSLIAKDLSLGVYSSSLSLIMDNQDDGFKRMFMDRLKKNGIKLKNPEVTFFMIIELVSSTCVHAITDSKPLPIMEFKPYLYDTIRMMLNVS